MDKWFTVEKIDGDTFAISEYGHWEETHCYLLCGLGSAVLIDTGLGISNIKKVADGLTRLPITVVTTHAHWDHIGGHGYFDRIGVHEYESSWLEGSFPIPLEMVKRNIALKPCGFPKGFDLENYRIFKGSPNIILHDGDCIDIGNRKLSVLHTPGHSPGHCCFYEGERGYLYSGDLIYEGCLDAFYPTTDPKLFRQSVKRVGELEISRVLPGHHRLDIGPEIAGRVEVAFDRLEEEGKLRQGSGIFDFGDFKIHL